ncbi:MAG: hypothetical protein COW59_05400 [Lysobacterales bacterium CG17_big_fil_post_rev_8_21_14_2_50_64_11]|nr:MAG: hypothetical protein COW59_05400 [Xanthomonadales bacterium CG17_big_fil_post_rev_8_21_14_2_50_64_11]PIX61361.1 MAG: hypothetical protein COZ47_02380 [Xanthomonadales bacterium CG_4_10_14_3_um_filter_64_11]
MRNAFGMVRSRCVIAVLHGLQSGPRIGAQASSNSFDALPMAGRDLDQAEARLPQCAGES